MSPISRREFVKGALAAPIALGPLGAKANAEAPATNDFDIVVAGAGHNSLVATAYLVTAGFKCVVLEGRPMIGGGTQSASLTLAGLHEDVCSTVHAMIQENPMFRNHEIDLKPYGLEYLKADPILHFPFLDGTSITMWLDVEGTAQEFAKFSKKDADTYRRLYKETEALGPIYGETNFNPPGTTKSFMELVGQLPHGEVWKRRMMMSAWDNIRYMFEDEHVRSFMMASSFIRTIPPEMPMTGSTAYAVFGEQRGGRPVPKGGSGKLADALAGYIQDRGGVVLTNKGVDKLLIDGGRCVGVHCVDGSEYHAKKAVLSSMHIKDIVKMAPAELWGEDFIANVDLWQGEPSAFLSHYALTEPPEFKLQNGKTIIPAESLILNSPESLFKLAYNVAVGEVDYEAPHQAMTCMTVLDPTRAPKGVHTMYFLSFAPFHLKEGPEHWDVIKEEAADKFLKFARRFSPNITDDKILARFCESPIDIWRRNPNFWHGSIHSGQMDAAQTGLMRPVPGWADYKMPIPGLYQTGATTHPGGSVSGAPGRNAVMVMLKDFGTSIPEVLSKKVK
jgi:phytoene dehydrogenase-like protein